MGCLSWWVTWHSSSTLIVVIKSCWSKINNYLAKFQIDFEIWLRNNLTLFSWQLKKELSHSSCTSSFLSICQTSKLRGYRGPKRAGLSNINGIVLRYDSGLTVLQGIGQHISPGKFYWIELVNPQIFNHSN